MATFKSIVFSSKNHVKSDGTTNIKIRVYHNEDSQYIPTKFYILPAHMSKSGEVFQECLEEADMINYELGEIIQQYRKLVLQLGTGRASKMTCKELRDYLMQASKPDYEFIDFVSFSRDIIKNTKKPKTASWYEQSINALVWHYETESIDVKEITGFRLNAFIDHLTRSGKNGDPLEPGSINNYLRAIRALFNKCKLKYNDDDLDIIRIPHDPFSKVRVPTYRRKRKNIGIEEIKKIRDGVFITEREQIGRDVFMMLFYLIGINVNDFYNLSPPRVGRIEYKRSKTDTEDNINAFLLSIRIEPELQALIDKYSKDGFLSGIRSRYCNSYELMRATNKGLKKICAQLGIPKVTTNWARHTWASLARNKAEIAKADVDFCLGHVNNDYKMADIYIDIDYSVCDRANRAVLDLLIEKKKETKNQPGEKKSHLRVV